MTPFRPRAPLPLLGFAFLAGTILAGCGGPRSLHLTEDRYPPRPEGYPVDVFVGEVEQSHRTIARIDTTGRPADDEPSRLAQLEELKARAREVGADAVHEVRLLTKRVRGLTTDERTPFRAWKQGEYPLYFMRGEAIVYESGLPGSISRTEGFVEGPEGFLPDAGEEADPSDDGFDFIDTLGRPATRDRLPRADSSFPPSFP